LLVHPDPVCLTYRMSTASSHKNNNGHLSDISSGNGAPDEKDLEIQRLQKELKEARMQFTLEMEKQISEIRSTALFSMESPAPQLRISLSGEVLWQNPAAYLLEDFDYQKRHFTADDFWIYIASVFPSESSWVLEVQSGNRYFSLYCRLFSHENYINIYGTDTTDKILAEEKIQLNEKRYRDLFNFSQALICTHDIAGNLITVNPAICHLLGYPENEFAGRHLTYFMPERARMLFYTDYLETIKQHGSAQGIFTVLTRAGKKRFLLFKNYLVKEPGSEPYVIASSQDITERKNIESDLKRSEEKYRRIIENMNLGLVEVDDHSHFVFANKVFCNMCGFELEELFGKEFGTLFLDDENLRLFNSKIKDRQRGITSAYELVAKNKYGELKWWFISGAPIYNRYNNQVGAVAVVLDITAQKQTQQQLQEAKIIADQSVKAKDDFLANMSHEIRTPMNAIIGLIRQMQKTTLNHQQQVYANAISNASSNLMVIINDILDFSKIAAGKLTIEYIGFRLQEVIHDAIEIVAEKADEKGIAIYSFFDEAIYPEMMGDPFRIKQVLTNLLSNAIKFTEKGSITISCTLQKQDEQRQYLHLAVTDTGIGMTEEFLEHLFDKFTQEDETIARRFGGTGLGMSIIKQLVELMNGTVEVQSRKNAGTKVTVTMPFEKGKVNATAKIIAAADADLLKHIKILLVEDNEMNRLLACSVLEQYGAKVEEAENGLDAIKMIKAKTYDIVLMDMRMPVMDGLQATKIIRKDVSSSLPVIALTANVIKRDKDKCLEAGMNDFLSKPFEEQDLVAIIAKWTGSNIQIEKGAIENHPPENFEHFSISRLRQLGKGNLEFERKMLNIFIHEASKAIQEFAIARELKDHKTIISVAHRIKASVMNMQIKEIIDEVHIMNSADSFPKEETIINNYLDKMIITLQNVIREIKENQLV